MEMDERAEYEGPPEDEEWSPPEAEEWRRHQESIGFQYLGILQGLFLGVAGNLLAFFIIEVLHGIVAEKYWFIIHLTGFFAGLFLVGWVAWKFYIKAGTYMYGKHFEEALKHRVRRRIKWYWWALRVFLRDRRWPKYGREGPA